MIAHTRKQETVDLRLIAMGNSQGGRHLVMYIQNGALRDAGVYDGLLPTATNPASEGGTTTFPAPGDVPSVPTLNLQSESEAGPPQVSEDRPTGRYESPLYRLWYAAGTSHTNHHRGKFDGTGLSGVDERYANGYGELGTPGAPCVNMFPKHYSYAAAIRGLDTWIRTGTPAADSPEFDYDADGSLLRDGDLNVVGGMRLGIVDAPVASYIGDSCGLMGTTVPFDDVKLRSRYPTHADYLNKLLPLIDANVAARILTPEDADDLRSRAEATAFRWEGPVSTPHPIGS